MRWLIRVLCATLLVNSADKSVPVFVRASRLAKSMLDLPAAELLLTFR